MRPLATRRRELLPAFQLVTRGAATILALDNPPISMARKRAITGAETAGNTAALGFEAKLWLAADKLRNNMDAAEYKHVVLGLIFLKYISDSFDEHHAKLVAGKGDFAGANPEDKDEYLAANVFWVPKEARWAHLQANAKLPSIGKDVDDAMVALERYNPRLKGALNKNYGRADLDKHRLFEYFLTQFASAEGKNGGQFYTPSCVVRLLVEMLAPYKGRIYDPACGSGGMFVQSEKFVESHGGSLGDISIYGQGSNPTTRRLTTTTATATGVAVAVAVARSGSVSFSTCRLKRRIDSLSACKSRQVKIRCKSSYMANKLDFKQQVAILGES
jgi:type I restriction enzyme M protein